MKNILALLALISLGSNAAPLQLVATDADGDPITWSFTGLPSGFTGSVTGLIDDTNADTVGDYTIQAYADDGTDTASLGISWQVSQAPPPNNPPVITDPGPQSTVIPYAGGPPPTQSGVHDSQWALPGDEITGTDIRVTAVTPFGFWAEYQLDASQGSTRPWFRLDGVRTRYTGDHMGSDAGFGGDSGMWVGPFYWDTLQPSTSYDIAFELPGGGLTETLTVMTRGPPAAPGQDFACSPATLGATPDPAWITAVRAQASSGFNPALLQGSYRAYPKALLAAFTGNGQDVTDALSILEFAIGPRAANDEDAQGSQHRWEGAYAAWAGACLYRQGHIDLAKLTEIANAYIGDLENIVPWNLGWDDTDKRLSNDRIGIVAGSLYTLLPAGTLRDRLEAVYQFHERQLYAVRLAMLRINGRFGVGAGWPNDGTEYGVGSLGYFLEILWWMQNDRPAEVAQYLPWMVNAAYMQAHQRVPGGGTRFSWGDHQSPAHDDAQSGTRHLLGWMIAQHGGPAAVTEHLATITGTDYAAWCALPVVSGAGLMETTYIARGGDASGVFSRSTWNTDATAIHVQFGETGVHHNHPDDGNIQFHRGGSFVVSEVPAYGFPGSASRHNTVVGSPSGQGRSNGGFQVVTFTRDSGTFDLELLSRGVYASDTTRRVVWDLAADNVAVTQTGVTDAHWNPAGAVTTQSPGVYLIP